MAWWIRVAVVAVTMALCVSVFVGWRDSRKEQAALQEELKTTQQALAEATARQTSRDATLNELLAQLRQQKAAVQKPEQVVKTLPNVLPLPEAITLNDETSTKPQTQQKDGEVSKPVAKTPASEVGHYTKAEGPATVDFPAADLKPLYDFAVDCRSCQAQLAAAQADLKDETVKEEALGRERDDALRTAKGGSVFRRVSRAAKWFAIGVAAGAIAARAAH